MEVIRIEGGHPVTGEVTVEGAKNSALKLMAATILAPGVTTLHNVPNISDVHIMGKVLKELGVERISINPQTMNDSVLEVIGRRHTSLQTIEAFKLARELGFNNINMDNKSKHG
jgi:UDP-N-acetylglucosamine enolpyruvyl transferase